MLGIHEKHTLILTKSHYNKNTVETLIFIQIDFIMAGFVPFGDPFKMNQDLLKSNWTLKSYDVWKMAVFAFFTKNGVLANDVLNL